MQRKRLLFAVLFAAIVMTPLTTALAKTDFESFIRNSVTSSLSKSTTGYTPAAGSAGTQSVSNNNTTATTSGASSDTKASIDTSTSNKGYVSVAYKYSGKTLKAYIECNGRTQAFSMRNDGGWTNIPLTLGQGDYTISIMQNTTGNNYSYVESAKASYVDTGSMDKYLKSIPTMEYNASMAAIQKATALCAGKKEADKVKAIYEYIVLNTSYDTAKLNNLPSGYEPNIEDTFKTRKGICYDYSALFGAMCRSQGIPCKLVKGYVTEVGGYHAWNRVYVDGQWRVVDSTSDAVYRASGYQTDMYKSSGYEISVSQEY